MLPELSLNLDDLAVETFLTGDAELVSPASVYPHLLQRPATTSPCLDSLQTCDPRCIA
jgi:hypothetical protein